MTTTAAGAAALGRVVSKLIAARGHASPEALAKAHPGSLSGNGIRRIIKAEDPHIDGDDGDFKLLRLAWMLRPLPSETLIYVRDLDLRELEMLDFAASGAADVQQMVTRIVMEATEPPPRRRRSAR